MGRFVSLRVVADTTKVRIFKQITTLSHEVSVRWCCCWYHKGTNFQANHNQLVHNSNPNTVVADTTKVRIFKQITTFNKGNAENEELLLIPQRYEFSSKSQRNAWINDGLISCCWYHKGTNFQANHNWYYQYFLFLLLLLIPQRYEFSSKSQPLPSHLKIKGVVADTTKVRIFKQITTRGIYLLYLHPLLLIPQRYEFSSKSQPVLHPL